ncbi:MAG: hypothetical protein MUF87_15880, partial [Anaerolineae bacterium]|nr:hypothetical protein [Anaerolineae bacterium]
LATIRHDGGRFRPLNRVNNTQNYIRTDGNMDWAYNSGVILPLPTATPTLILTPTPTQNSCPAFDSRAPACQVITPTPTGTLPPLTFTPSPTYTSCLGRTSTTIDNTPINVRERPWETVVGTVPALTDIILHGGWSAVQVDGGNTPTWWWYMTYGNLRGYVNESLIQTNSCPRHEIAPPPEPVPEVGALCYVRLTGASASVFNWQDQVVDTISNQVPILVYGRSNELVSERYLIALPGTPQRWINKSLFTVASPEYIYGCLERVLGRFRYEEDGSSTWRNTGHYANNFLAPVDFTTIPYPELRNSQLFGGHHLGIDLIHGPPAGAGNPQDFPVFAQHHGIIVDAGPSGITGRLVVDGLSQHPYPERAGTYFEGNVLYAAITWFYDSDLDNDIAETPTSGYRYDKPPFGIQNAETREILAQNGVFRIGVAPCTAAVPHEEPRQNQPLPPGCVGGADRQVIIWYAADETLGVPDIQVIYYHVSVDEVTTYNTWRGVCSRVNRMETWQRTTNNDPMFQGCRVNPLTSVGHARWIGWSSTSHLHYEIWIYNSITQKFEFRIDPLITLQTFR